jgi:peptidoglycan/xylan/chitin deacetylase (PgdA/CDA1 family)
MGIPIVSALPAPAPRAVALTFDDGPSANTPEVQAVLARHGGRGTFFVQGNHVELHPELARAGVEAGHELGNHTWAHAHLEELSDDEILDQLGRTAALVELETGRPMRVLRCPYGTAEGRVAALAATHGFAEAIVHWSVDPEDWSDPPPETIVERVLQSIHPGAIVCLHDGPGRSATVAALLELVPRLVADGYALVTVSELLALGENTAS